MGEVTRFGLRYISAVATVTVLRHRKKVQLVQTIWIGPFRNLESFTTWSATFQESLKHQITASRWKVLEHVLSPSAAAHITADMDPESLPFDAAHDLYTFIISKDEAKRTAES